MITAKRLPIAFLTAAMLIVAACGGGGGNLGSVPPASPSPSASTDPGPDLTPEPSDAHVGPEFRAVVRAQLGSVGDAQPDGDAQRDDDRSSLLRARRRAGRRGPRPDPA